MATTEKIFGKEFTVTDHGGHLTAIGYVLVETINLTIELLQFAHSKVKGWVPAKIRKTDGKLLWSYDQEKAAGFTGLAKLHEHDGELVIAFYEFTEIQGKRKNAIVKIIPLLDLTKSSPVMIAKKIRYIGGRPLIAIAKLKMALAKEVDYAFVLDENEQGLINREREAVAKKLQEKRVAEAEKIRQEKLAADQRAQAERTARKLRLDSRPDVTAYNEDGRKFSGKPMVGNDWQSLKDGAHVILVDSYDDETKVVGTPLEKFIVGRKGTNKAKVKIISKLTWSRPVAGDATAEEIPEGRFVTLLVEGNIEEFFCVSPADAKKLAAKGVNSGTRIALDVPDADGRLPVVPLKDGQVGNFEGLYSVAP